MTPVMIPFAMLTNALGSGPLTFKVSRQIRPTKSSRPVVCAKVGCDVVRQTGGEIKRAVGDELV